VLLLTLSLITAEQGVLVVCIVCDENRRAIDVAHDCPSPSPIIHTHIGERTSHPPAFDSVSLIDVGELEVVEYTYT